jgi:formylglycine-generating enzyme required for sulfatase activity
MGYSYPWGVNYKDNALNHGQMQAPNYDDSDGYLRSAPVGSFPSGNSPYGLSDMFGNVWEFTSDYRRSSWDFYTGEQKDVTATGPGLYVAVRGGAYFFDLRPNPGGERNEFLTEIRRKTSGFRCAK